jgi:copper(I)-binding protein
MSRATFAQDFKKDDLVISHPWTRATPGGATVGAGYLTITNNGTEPDRITGGTFQGADRVEIHQMTMDGNTMKMRHLPEGVEIKPGATVKFAPSSYHLMFFGLKKPIVKGPDVKGSLIFQKAGSVAVDFKVEPIGAMNSSDTSDGGMKMDDSKMMHDHMQ